VKEDLSPQPAPSASPSGWGGQRLSAADIAFALLLGGMAAALRFWRLGQWGYYYDEGYTVYHTERIRWHFVCGLPVIDWMHPEIASVPLMPVLMRLVFEAWGVNEWSARLVQAVFGVAAAPVFYLLFTRMSGRWLGWVGALLITLSPWHVFHSQEARYYAAVFLFGGVAMCAFYLGLEHDRPGWMLVTLLSLLLGFVTHTTIVFVGGALLVYLILLRLLPFEKPAGLRWRTLRWFMIPIAAGFLIKSPRLIGFMNWGLTYEEKGYTAPHIVFAVAYNFGLPLIAIAAFGAAESLRQRDRLGLFAVVGAGVPLLTLLFLTFVFKAGMGPRYLMGSAPAYFLLAAYGGVQVLRHITAKSRWLSMGLVGLMLTAQLPLLLSYYYDGDRADYKRAAAFLSAHAGSTDEVFAPQSPYTLESYLHRPVQLLTASENDLRKFEQNPQVTRWVVVVVGRTYFVKDENGILERWLQKHGQLSYEYRSGQFDHHVHHLRVYKIAPASSRTLER